MDVSTVPDDGPVTVTTNKGTKIDADIVFKTIGLPVQSEAYRNSLGEAGQILISIGLALKAHKNC